MFHQSGFPDCDIEAGLRTFDDILDREPGSSTGMPPHKLRLKVGAVVVVLRNLSLQQGVCNGTRLQVTAVQPNLLVGKILAGERKGETVLLPKISLQQTENDEMPFRLKRRQFPVRLGFAMTINKSQGQTFDRLGIHLLNPVFSHGQLYVAWSRVRSFASVKVLLPARRVKTKYVVYREVLL